MAPESERETRWKRIDPHLRAAGWSLTTFKPGLDSSKLARHAVREFETTNGPADYALVVDGKVLGIVEAKKVSLGPQGVLYQAERYSKGVTDGPVDIREFRVPFLYSTNGEVIWHHDIRGRLNRSRRIAGFHTPEALRERFAHSLDGACRWLDENPNQHPRLRPYQADANAAIEKAIADRKRQMLVAMATGTGKTFTLVNGVYRLMKAGVGRRILFLVDRRALAAQAVRTFASRLRGVASLFSIIGTVDGRGRCAPLGLATTVVMRSSAGRQAIGRLRPAGEGTAQAYASGFAAPLGLMIQPTELAASTFR